MNEDKLTRFAHDVAMSEAVYELLMRSFLKRQHTDVHMLAASRLALDYLSDAWRELEQYKRPQVDASRGGQVGL